MTLKVSVVIPVYNRPDLLNRAVSSVSRQSFAPFEILVVDDGSTPTVRSLKDFNSINVRILRNEQNKGVSAARNLGILEASGDWIALLDSDDEWMEEKLQKQIQHLEQHEGLLAVHTGEKWIRNGNEVIPPAYLNKSPDNLWERSLQHCLICPSSVLLHKSIFQNIGLFNENLPVCEDYEFWLRLLIHKEIGLVEEKLVIKHGGHSDQLSTTTWGMDRFRAQALINLIESSMLNEKQYVSAISVLVNKCMIVAKGSQKREKFQEATKFLEISRTYQAKISETTQNHHPLK
jgi:glycosyltransferase involved in cell wall biosynthesis